MQVCWSKAAIAIAVLVLPLDEARAAGGAYAVDTAEVSEVGACKVESWVSGAINHDFIAAIAPTCVVDIARPVETSVQIARARSGDQWSSSATPKLKTNIVPSAIGSWGVAISGAASYDLTTASNTAVFATVPATLRLSDVFRINLNSGWQWDRVADRHYLTYGFGTDWRTPDNIWTLTAEIYGQLGARQDSPGVTEPRFQIGLRWRPVDRFNVDVIYGRNIAGENSNWVTLGTTVRF
ncbi:MAG: hypothetical protein JO254_16035 [Pseudolabrys sp.]|nr:hypothetical protein [Pseudolabrys sp.]